MTVIDDAGKELYTDKEIEMIEDGLCPMCGVKVNTGGNNRCQDCGEVIDPIE